MKKLPVTITVLCIFQLVSAQQPKLVLPVGHTQTVFKTIFSSSGRYILTASWDKTARLWDRAQQKLLFTFDVPRSGISDIAFDRSEAVIAVASADSSFTIWDIPTCRARNTVRLKQRIYSIEFNKESTRLLIQSGDSARVFSVKTGKEVRTIPLSVTEVSYMDDYKYIACKGYSSADIQLFDTQRGEASPVIFAGHANGVTGFNLLKKTGLAISTSYDQTLIRWDMQGRIIDKIEIGFPIASLAVSADEEHAVLISKSNYLETWNLKTMKKTDSIHFQTDARLINGDSSMRISYTRKVLAKFLPGRNELIVAADNMNEIRSYTLGPKLLLQHIFTSKHNILYDLSVSPDGESFILSHDQNPVVFDSRNTRPVGYLMGHTYQPTFIKPVLSDSFLIVKSKMTEVEVWDMHTQKLAYTLAGKTAEVQHIAISPSEQKFATITRANKLEIWDTRSGELLQQFELGRTWTGPTLEGDGATIRKMEGVIVDTFVKTAAGLDGGRFSNDEKLFIAFSSNSIQMPIVDLETNKLKFNIVLDMFGADDAVFSPDSKKILILCRNSSVVRVDISARALLFLDGNETIVRYATFNQDGSQLVSVDDAGQIYVRDPETGEVISDDLLPKQPVSLLYTNDAKNFVVVTDNAVYLFDAKTHIQTKKIIINDEKLTKAENMPDNSRLLLHYKDGTKGILNLENGQLISLKKSVGRVSHLSITRNGRCMISESGSLLTKWDLTNQKNIASFFSIDSTASLTIVKNGYYQASPEATKMLHYVTEDLRVINFEQLDVKYNRPDRVLEAIGSRDTLLKKSYYRAWEKRIKKLGIDTSAFENGYHVPTADFTNRYSIGRDQATGSLALTIRGKDSTYKLDRFNIWINESPLFGQRGISLRNRNKNNFDTTIVVQLSNGDNRIETSITNVNGTESYRMPLQINYRPSGRIEEKLFFIGIGIDQFAERAYNLRYSAKDIRDLALKLKEKYGNKIVIDTLFNQDVNVSNVRQLKKRLLETGVNDKVIISYSGHGMLSKDFDYYLSTYPVNFTKPEKGGLAYDELEDLLDGIPARKKLLLLDACHSGEVDKEDLVRLNNKPDSLIKGLEPVAYEQNGQFGLQNSFELMQNIFVNVGKKTGATVISAAAGTQFALERDDLKNGVFTYAILEAMNKYQTLNVSQLKKLVGERVVQITNGLQKPTSRTELIAVDWEVW